MMTNEGPVWLLREFTPKHSLSWGGLAAIAKISDYDVVVLTALELQFEEDGDVFGKTRVIRFPYDDEASWVASAGFRESLVHNAREVASALREAGRKGEAYRLLVTCAEGYNRSALFLARVYYELTGLPGFLLVREIRAQRRQALFRDAFREWVEEWPPFQAPALGFEL